MSIEEESYSIPDEHVDYKIQDHIQLALFSGGIDFEPEWSDQPLGDLDTGKVNNIYKDSTFLTILVDDYPVFGLLVSY